jgi:probable O-glycosylation ligase (exosortase A-associated)
MGELHESAPARMGIRLRLSVCTNRGIATIVSVFLSREPKTIPWKPLTAVWLLFIAWMIVTTIFAIYPGDAYVQLKKVLKIQLVTFLTLMLINSKERVNLLIWVIVISIGFYSVKGGFFTLVTGGGSRVFGPERSFIADNNALALATLMVVPLMEYLRQQSANRWVRLGLVVSMLLSVASALGSHSRGAFLASLAVAAYFWIRSSHKVVAAVAVAGSLIPLFLLMPESWHERIGTITKEPAADVRDIESMRTRDGEGRSQRLFLP